MPQMKDQFREGWAKMALPLHPTLVAIVWLMIVSSIECMFPTSRFGQAKASRRFSVVWQCWLGQLTMHTGVSLASLLMLPREGYTTSSPSKGSLSTTKANSSLTGLILNERVGGSFLKPYSSLRQALLSERRPLAAGMKMASSHLAPLDSAQILWQQVRTTRGERRVAEPQVRVEILPFEDRQLHLNTPVTGQTSLAKELMSIAIALGSSHC